MSSNNLLMATPELRWVRRLVDWDYGVTVCWTLILQQYWTDPLGVSGKGEWRDIPTVNETVTESTQEPPILEN